MACYIERGHLPSFVPALVNVAPEANLLKVVCSVSLHQIVPSALGGGVRHVDTKSSIKCQIIHGKYLNIHQKYVIQNIAELQLPGCSYPG